MLRPDFAGQQSSDNYYDIHEDWDLVVSSFASQYGIRLVHEGKMPWKEFSSLLAGLGPETPLGRIVSIRSEKDRKTILQFNPYQRKIYNDWRRRKAKDMLRDPEALKRQTITLSKALEMAFGPKPQ